MKTKEQQTISNLFNKSLRLHPSLPFMEEEKQIYLTAITNALCLHFANNMHTFHEFHKNLPILSPHFSDTCFTFSIITYAKFRTGVDNFISDMLLRWFIPGYKISIIGKKSILFLLQEQQHEFFFLENHIAIADETQKKWMKKHLHTFIQNIRLNILAVEYSLHLSLKNQSYNLYQKAFTPTIGKKSSLTAKILPEKSLMQIEKSLSHLMQRQFTSTEENIYKTMHHVTMQFPFVFTSHRNMHYVSRLIGLQYFFKKSIIQDSHQDPNRRHIRLKLLETTLQGSSSSSAVIGILLAMNFTNFSEKLDKNAILEAIWHCLPSAKYVQNSYLEDPLEEKIRCFYLEITKDLLEEKDIRYLKHHLVEECKNRIENIIHPVFMPRNEEEVLRNIILLSKQLKYVKDLPQVIINYEKQKGKDVIFTVTLLRLLKHNRPSLQDIFAQADTFLKFLPEEVKIVGYLKKYPKEANTFKIALNRCPFIRRDSFLDLQKARQCVVKELTNVIGEFRDYNGGMIFKQSQALDKLKNVLSDNYKKDELLLEDFFYSLKPGLMQSMLSTEIIKAFYLLYLDIKKQNYHQHYFHLKTATVQQYFLVMIGAKDQIFKNEINKVIKQMNIPSFDLTSSFIVQNDITSLGYIYHNQDPDKRTSFYQAILKGLRHNSASSAKSIE